ncbi:2-dehydro-3-deoxygalactonokinase [Erythrobacteraceae bacterium CFH 75059]|uniref:2-dehydro-3-deoxygalactonokinase n=1 Tax=Qipengyuania thermophila TaxID=2509361 RepID=UPI001020252D|nr:2-dehydro-3-deoxygalactonokinase [Qipengyuania thermophila]TCD02061.1 2-dehydro-3-deoxygalactonokinase [Erythrobacteraceae bacterium CFH 75059]
MMRPPAPVILVDWGTTNRRATLVGPGGAVLGRVSDGLGVRSVPAGGFDEAVAGLRTALGDHPMLLAGMIGSARGWREAPYLACPVALDDLADAIVWVEPGRTGIVPGACVAAERGGPDVMRGEEVQVLGAVAAGAIPPDALVCHPGTHTKWMRVAGGRLAWFRTRMTGELFALLREHSLLAARLTGEAEDDADFRRGVRRALDGGDLLGDLFQIRVREVLKLDLGSPASFASGLLIGSDVASGIAAGPEGVVHVLGQPSLGALYAAALAEAGRQTLVHRDEPAFLRGMQALADRVLT